MLQDLLQYLDLDNIAIDLDEEKLRDIGNTVYEGYKNDLMSRGDWEKRNEEYLKLAMQVKESKTFPWPGAANIKFPILTEASIQFAARASSALIPGMDVVRAFPIGADPTGEKNKRATRISKHMSYQVLEEMEDWEEEQDRLLHIVPIIGCAFKKTYYCPIKQQNKSNLVLPNDVVVDYWAKSLEDAHRITHRMYMSRNEIHSQETSGLFLEVDYEDSNPTELSTKTSVQDQTQPQYDDSAPILLLEQHTYLDLDEDGYYEPYIVTIDEKTRQVVRIVARYDEEGINADETEEIISVEPVHYFTKYGFLPNPDGGFYDIGFGLLLTGINETVNTTINQLLDAGTMATTAGGFLGRGIRLKGGNYSFQPNEWKQLQSTGDDIRKNVYPLPIREPSPTLFNLLGLMITSAQRLAGTVDSLQGENPGQNQKATTTALTVEQGLKVFNGIYKRTHRAMKKEFKKLFRLNRLYLDTEKYFSVLDPYEQEVVQVAPLDYEDEIDIVPTADPNISSEQQRMAKDMALLQAYQVSPGTMNPAVIQRRMLEDQNQFGIEELLKVPPPQPSLDMLQFQDESERSWAEIRLKAMELKDKSVVNQAKAIKDIADAESKEKGTQLQLYQAFIDQLIQEEESFNQLVENIRSRGEQNESGNEEPTSSMVQ